MFSPQIKTIKMLRSAGAAVFADGTIPQLNAGETVEVSHCAALWLILRGAAMLLALCLSAWGTPSVVQSANNGCFSTSCSITITPNSTSNVLIYLSWFHGAVTTIASGCVTTWTQVMHDTNWDNLYVSVGNPSGTSSCTITNSQASAALWTAVWECSGCSLNLDGGNGAKSFSNCTTGCSGTSFTPVHNGDLLLGFISDEGGANEGYGSGSWSDGTTATQDFGAVTGFDEAAAHGVQTTAAPVHVTFTSSANPGTEAIANFAIQAGGGGAAAPIGLIYKVSQAINRASTYFITTVIRPLWLPTPEVAFIQIKSRRDYIRAYMKMLPIRIMIPMHIRQFVYAEVR